MDTEQVKQVLENVYHGDYESPEAARTAVNGALEFVEGQLKELIEQKTKLDNYKFSLLTNSAYLEKQRAAHPRAEIGV